MENEIIKITTNEEGKQLVSARELHEFLEVKSKFADWIKNRIKKYDFIENEDYICLSKILETQTKEGKKGIAKETDYAITIDMAKELSMVENNEKAKNILDKLNNKIHEGDIVKVVKVLAASDKYKKLLGKMGIVIKVDDFIDVQIDGTVYYFKREEIKRIGRIDHMNK